MRLVRALALAALATACNVVTSDEPLGTTPLTLDPAAWDGTWLHAEGSIALKVTDPEAGGLVMVSIDESNDTLETSVSHLRLMHHDGWTFANLRPEEEPDTNYWFRVQTEGRQLIAWLPSPARFAEAIEAGHLPGEVDEHGNVHLPELTAEQLEVITDSTHGILVEWEQPIAFLRVSDKAGI